MQIPAYPDARPLGLDDKHLLDPVFHLLQPRVSELTFAGLYLFRHPHAYQLTMVGNALVVVGRGYDGGSYALPPLTGDVAAALRILFSSGVELYGVDEEFAGQYLQGGEVVLTEDRDNFDYLYLREDLANLSGNRFHSKRNRVSYFISRHACRTELLEERHVPGCLALLEEWRQLPQREYASSLEPEVQATAEALQLFDSLGLSGVVIMVDEVPRAFVLGERLNRETAVCHFEKYDPFMDGIAQLVNREFSRLLFPECRLINREQDLGQAGLRRAKLSYRPVELVKKFRARPGAG